MKFLLRVLVKGLLLFALVNVLFAVPVASGLGQLSAYNGLFPGRPRFPFGETPREAYNFSLFDMDAMYAAHEYSLEKPEGEFRIAIIGDSSVWGTLLQPYETLAGQLNALDLQAPDGRDVRFYNLGYPTISLTKDLMLMEDAVRYQPDMIVWLVTLEAFPLDRQMAVPLVANNPSRAARFGAVYGLPPEFGSPQQPGFWERTLFGRRKNLADLVRLQLYGILWAATGIDQVYPADYPRAQVDLENDRTYQGRESLEESDLAFAALDTARRIAGEIPLLLVNEPILVSQGANSQVRYNFYYPRWAYDQYRGWLARHADRLSLPYLDVWDLVPAQDFTNSAIHINAQGTVLLSREVAAAVQGLLGELPSAQLR